MGWFIQEAKKRGIAVSLSDYTLGSPGQGGKGRIFFFSDELNFNIRGRLWNVFFADEFQKGRAMISVRTCIWFLRRTARRR